MLAVRAEVVATGPSGERVIPIDAFFVGLFATALAPNEILTEIRIPVPPAGSGGAYLKLERKVGDYATVGVAAQVSLKGGVIDRVGLGLTNVGLKPVRAVAAEGQLRGKKPDEAVLAEAGRLAEAAANPSPDRRGSVEYKKHLVRVLTIRALRKAVGRAGGN
jgi:carbon-monoxide dehydrogenase medium subunit